MLTVHHLETSRSLRDPQTDLATALAFMEAALARGANASQFPRPAYQRALVKGGSVVML